jgi:CheY-like chemotaxis protein
MNQTIRRTAQPALQERDMLESLSAEPQARRGIVIAEDNAAARRLLRSVFTREGFRVHTCQNGKLACEAVRCQRPDVILLDWLMPVMDGLRAAQLLKADVVTRAIPIVMITALSEIEDRNLALAAGVQDFVAKPYDVHDLVACIEQQLRWRMIIATARTVDRRWRVTEERAQTRS